MFAELLLELLRVCTGMRSSRAVSRLQVSPPGLADFSFQSSDSRRGSLAPPGALIGR